MVIKKGVQKGKVSERIVGKNNRIVINKSLSRGIAKKPVVSKIDKKGLVKAPVKKPVQTRGRVWVKGEGMQESAPKLNLHAKLKPRLNKVGANILTKLPRFNTFKKHVSPLWGRKKNMTGTPIARQAYIRRRIRE